MRNFYKKNRIREMLKPLAVLFLFLALIINVNAQVVSTNKITSPAVVVGTGSFNPGVIMGSAVIIKDAGDSKCPGVTYEWQSATDAAFTKNLKTKLAVTKDYSPGTVTRTTYFRRIVRSACTDPEMSSESATPGIKITIN
jgi:hypothetical protein